MPDSSGVGSLLPLLFICSLLLFCAIGWCILSSCLGKPLLELFSEIWQAAWSPSNAGRDGFRQYRRVAPGLRDEEMWEMEYRSRVG
ncbi:hypothetical protein NEOLEDRAFT_1130613 [Neolentinus lepideus HHB14362 ss-1]|uniref:Uncharacterized protein n=1 Tax=Neolentinus lepideus HHB14362 ss-1 TaxID=1314782 RepID=A0A165U3Y5_9AGAM|nr:hypothetical protein NEOLEDRAFT_1130613 [Neolentinus lepideus HHB14362 ss-1]